MSGPTCEWLCRVVVILRNANSRVLLAWRTSVRRNEAQKFMKVNPSYRRTMSADGNFQRVMDPPARPRPPAPSRQGCVVAGQTTEASNKLLAPPFPPALYPSDQPAANFLNDSNLRTLRCCSKAEEREAVPSCPLFISLSPVKSPGGEN